MATPSPPPASATSPPSPSTSPPPQPSPSTPPPQQSSSPPDPPTVSPSSQNSGGPPSPVTSAPSPLVQSPPPADPASPPLADPTAPPPADPTTPPSTPLFSPPQPSSAPPPPSSRSPPLAPALSRPPPQQSFSPESPPPPPPSSDPPSPSTPIPPPSPATEPPSNSTPPPSSNFPPPSPNNPENPSPPPQSKPPENSPPPPLPSAQPPQSSPPPPSSTPPENSPPPPASTPPRISPPPPASTPPENSPPPPALVPTNSTPPPPRSAPPPAQPTPSPSNSSRSSPPPPNILLAPPPPSLLSPPPPSEVSSENRTVNNSSPIAPDSSSPATNGGLGGGGVIAIGVVAGVIVLSIIGLAIWCFKKQRKDGSGHGVYVMPSSIGSSPRSDSTLIKVHSSVPPVVSGSGSESVYSPPEGGGLGNSRSWFTYEELVAATNGFSPENLLGEGGFGSVYKGFLPDGREIAVKELKIGGGQGKREFKAEVEIISRIHHRHLVSLVGYCIADSRRLLVYEYVPNDTLHYHLHVAGRLVLEWEKRVKVAAGAARGLAYLHEDCHPRIIHRDIKSSNILLDNNFEARVSDFGLAKLALDADTHITTRVMGTFGYVAPEYASSGKLTDKSDVYSFGVVLLELITGRKPVDASQPLGDESLVEWARPLLSHALESGQFEHLVDARLEKSYVENEMFRMIEVAAACVRHSAAKRPRMGQVVRAFDSLATSDLSNGMRVGESEAFNSAQQSAEIRFFRRLAFGSQEYSTDFFSQNSLNT